MKVDSKRKAQRAYEKRTNYAAQRKYIKEHARPVTISLYTPKDDDIINFLNGKKNKTGYIRELIQADMLNN